MTRPAIAPTVLTVLLACGGSPPASTTPVPRLGAETPAAARPADAPPTETTPAPTAPTAPPTESTGCPAGVEASDLWPGEYPGPVVEIFKPTMLPIVTVPCGAPVKRVCTVAPRFLHPWAKPAGRYLSVRAVQTHRAKVATTLNGGPSDTTVAVPAGGTAELLTPLSEGYCAWRVNGVTYTDMCPDPAVWEQQSGVDFAPRQLAEVTCQEGGGGLVVVTPELLTVDGVREGRIVGYGEIGAAQ